MSKINRIGRPLATAVIALSIVASSLVATAQPAAAVGTIVPYANTPGSVVSPNFTMTANATPILVESFNGIHYARFSFSGTADIVVTASAAITSRSVSPTALAIATTVVGSALSFSIAQDRRLIVKVNAFANLIIIADPLEVSPPAPGNANVKNVMDFSPDATGATISTTQIQAAIDWVSANHATKPILYFPAGTYLSGTLKLKDFVQLYLSSGAILKGTANYLDYPLTNYNIYNSRAFIMAEDVHDVAIFGRGVIDGQGKQLHTNWGVNWSSSRLFSVYFAGVTTGSISDVIIRDSRFWHTTVMFSTAISITNLKMISPPVTVSGVTPKNTDGVNIGSSSDVTVDRALIYNNDDGSSIGSDLINGNALDAHDITFTNSVIYTGAANGLRLSPVVASGRTLYDIHYSYNYIVRAQDSAIAANTAAGYATPGSVRNITYDHIYVQSSGTRNFDLALLQTGSGPRRDILFSDMYFDTFGGSHSRVQGFDASSIVSNYYFRNLYIAGVLRTTLAAAQIDTNAFTSNITVLGAATSSLSATGVTPIANLQTYDLEATSDYDWVLPNVDQRNASTRIAITGAATYFQDAANYPRFSYDTGTTFVGPQTKQAYYRYSAPVTTISVPAGSGTVSLWVGAGGAVADATLTVTMPGATTSVQTFGGRQLFTFVYAASAPTTIQATLTKGSNANVGIFAVGQ
jgi:polygalacturonase